MKPNLFGDRGMCTGRKRKTSKKRNKDQQTIRKHLLLLDSRQIAEKKGDENELANHLGINEMKEIQRKLLPNNRKLNV